MPTYLTTPTGITVAIPRAFVCVDAGTGSVRWTKDADRPSAAGPIVGRVPRVEMFERALAGLPVPPGRGFRLEPIDGFAASDSLAARLYAGRALQVLDPASGRELLRLPLNESRGSFGARLAAIGEGLAVLLPRPQRLLYFDFRGEQPLAEWRLRQAGYIRAMLRGPGQALYLADYDGVYRFDLHKMYLTGKWPVAGGVDRLLSADEDLLLLATLDGRLLALDAEDGSTVLDTTCEGSPAWAAHRSGTVFVLQAQKLRRFVERGAQAHAEGSGFVLRALRARDAGEVWRIAWPGTGRRLMAPPRPSGELWLLASTEHGAVRVAGVHMLTGEEAFSIELETGERPGPASLLIREGRLLIGCNGRLTALEPASHDAPQSGMLQ